jgi:phosphatidylglycerophosphate synthase
MLKPSHGPPNYSNIITFIRLCLTFLIGFLYTALSNSAIAVTALVVISMDGLDGYLARRFKSSSTTGAYFDKETDAFFVCIMCSAIYLKGYLGSWILLIGFMRYIYVLVLFFLNISQRNEPSSRFAQVIAGILFYALITPFVMTENLYVPCILLSSILLIISFSHSFVKTVFSGK